MSSSISMDSFGIYLSPEHFLNFPSNLYIPPWLGEIFKFIVFRLLENKFVCQKIESSHFYSYLPGRNSSSPFGQREITLRKLKKWPKLKLCGYWSHVLISSITFVPFSLYFNVLLYHNLDIMLKSRSSLT